MLSTPPFGYPMPIWPVGQMWKAQMSDQLYTLDAVNERVDLYGWLYWEDEPTSAKTVSSSGGAIVWRTFANSTVWATAGSTIRIGIQDLDLTAGPPARGDGTHDVFADLVQGTESIASNTTYETAMESGSKSIAHMARICVRIEMTVRNGADVVHVQLPAGGPYQDECMGTTISAGGSYTYVNGHPNCLIKADDGKYGWFLWRPFVETVNVYAFNSGSTPDEHALICRWPRGVWVHGLVGENFAAGSDASKGRIYTTPFGTPASQREASVDHNTHTNPSGASGGATYMFDTPFYVRGGTDVALAVQPGSGTCNVYYANLWSTLGRKPFRALGGTYSHGYRSNDTGAFTEETNIMPMIAPIISGFGPDRRARSIVGVM